MAISVFVLSPGFWVLWIAIKKKDMGLLCCIRYFATLEHRQLDVICRNCIVQYPL